MGRGNGRGFRGRGRGGSGGGGRGNSGSGGNRGGGGRGGGRGMPGWSMLEEDLEFNIRMFADAPNASGSNTPNGKGKGGRGARQTVPNSGTATPNRGRGRSYGYDSPRGRGYDSPRGSGRGRGAPSDAYFTGKRAELGIGVSPRGRGGGPQKRPDTLSGLLYQERPFLRPIKFVPSVLTKVLFEQEEDEELFKPIVEDVDETEQSHVPTADQVFRVFSGGNIPRMGFDSNDEDEDKEEIEEVDFNEVEQLFNPSAEVKTTIIPKSKLGETTIMVEETFTGFYVDLKPASAAMEKNLPREKQSETIDIDVNDLTKMVEETLSTTDEQPNKDDVEMSAPPAEESIIMASGETAVVPTHREMNTRETQKDLFYIDVQPSFVPEHMAPLGNHVPSALRDEEDDDIIVYVAPHPRKGDAQNEETTSPFPNKSIQQNEKIDVPRDTSHFEPYERPATLPLPSLASSSTVYMPSAPAAPPSFSSVSFSFSQKTSTATPNKEKSTARLVVPPVSTPRQAKAWKRKRGVTKKGRMKSSFGAFGAMREEAMLHTSDPRRHERRRGDSDLEWGDSDDDGGEVDEVEEGLEGLVGWNANGKVTSKENETAEETTSARDKGKGKEKALVDDDHGMDVDPDLAPNMAAMKSFVGGLLGRNAGQHTSIDDLNVAEMIRIEDEEEENHTGEDEDSEEVSSAEEDVEDVLAAEEAMMISETLEFNDDEFGEEDSDDDDEDEDEDQTPRTSFRARLERLRNKARSQKTEDSSFGQMDEDEDDEDEDDMLQRNMTWADEDEEFIQEIQDIVDENEDILRGKDRKARNAVFRSIRNGDFEDIESFSPAKKNKDKGKDLPPELRALWEKDRQKKAEYKKARDIARLENAADPLSQKMGGKKGRKAMIAAAKLDPTITVIPNRVIDMVTLVQQIRRFIAEIGGPASMSLPPTNKETRKNIHEMAIAFNLKSVSKGKGDARYTTLTKTTRTGWRVDELKIAKIVRSSGGMGARGDSFIYDKKGKAPTSMPRHREGEEVGKAAPKLTETNVGFRMLSMMGWSEGDRIGFAGGLDAPLTAIIKHTKLGLGATR